MGILFKLNDDAKAFTTKDTDGDYQWWIIDTDVIRYPDPSSDDTGSPDDLLHVAQLASGGIIGPSGWIMRSLMSPASDDGLQIHLEERSFVRECVDQELVMNAAVAMEPFFVNADYLLAVALIETDMQNKFETGVDSNGFGPFSQTHDEWQAFAGSDFGGPYYDSLHIYVPNATIPCAAYQMHESAKALSALWANGHAGDETDPYIPRFGELLRCRMIGVQRTFDMQLKLKNGAGVQSLADFLLETGLSEEQAQKTLNYRHRFMRNGGAAGGDPLTLAGFDKKCSEILNDKLKTTFDLIKTHAPYAISSPSKNGDAPWMEFAKQELVDKVSQATHPARIEEYFDSTGYDQGTANDPWCGAFVGWCMDRCDGKVEEHYNIVRNNAASAAVWTAWGDMSIRLKDNPPIGAVVVLASSKNTGEISHVGFFKSYNNDKQEVTVLGGNQSKAVTEMPVRAVDIVAIRWKNFLSLEGALDVQATEDIPNGRVETAQIIADLFAAAGYGRIQQIAAIANAIAESALDPLATGDGGHSIGLFQCHMTKGEGIGHSANNLKLPEYNTKVIIGAANRHGSFADAETVNEATRIFVIKVERPKDTSGAVSHRTQIANRIADALLA